MNLHRPVIKISSAPSLHYSIRRTSPLMLTLGSAPSSPSSPYYLPHVQMRTRHSLQPNNSVTLPASGGIIIMPCKLPVMSSLGTSFGPLFERTTSPKDSLSKSYQQGQGQEASGPGPLGKGEPHHSLRTPRGDTNNDGYFLYQPSTRDCAF
jgi:hypothetical protein